MNIPDGWQLVPKEPTRGMLNAIPTEKYFGKEHAETIYKAMLTAAPTPVQGECKHEHQTGGGGIGSDGSGYQEWTCVACGKHERKEWGPGERPLKASLRNTSPAQPLAGEARNAVLEEARKIANYLRRADPATYNIADKADELLRTLKQSGHGGE